MRAGFVIRLWRGDYNFCVYYLMVFWNRRQAAKKRATVYKNVQFFLFVCLEMFIERELSAMQSCVLLYSKYDIVIHYFPLFSEAPKRLKYFAKCMNR